MSARGKKPEWVKNIVRKQPEFLDFLTIFCPSVLDHYRFEENKLIAEPYQIIDDDIQEFLVFCKEHNLEFYITGKDRKINPETVKIVVEPKAQKTI